MKKIRKYRKQKEKVEGGATIYPFPNIHRDTRKVRTVMTLNGKTVAIDGTEDVSIPMGVANDV